MINRADDTDRWDAIVEHLAEFGIEPHRFEAVEPVNGVPLWRGKQMGDIPKRVAIVKSYTALMGYLQDRPEGWFVILQDDTRLSETPIRDYDRPLHLLGGYKLRGRHRSPCHEVHICPRGFVAHSSILSRLQQAWNEPINQACRLWCRLIRPDTTSWDDPRTAEETSWT
ncbi:MAG: hypothetical protein GY906_10400 [bacterium]|nr:hypothetical protein [bacterium]